MRNVRHLHSKPWDVKGLLGGQRQGKASSLEGLNGACAWCVFLLFRLTIIFSCRQGALAWKSKRGGCKIVLTRTPKIHTLGVEGKRRGAITAHALFVLDVFNPFIW